MLTWIMRVLFLLLSFLTAVLSSPLGPSNVTFSSVNFRNVLQWCPGNGTPDDTKYNVQYAIYGESVKTSKGQRANWRPVLHCTEITRHWCDLSYETSDLEHGYHARVKKINSTWVATQTRFDPKIDTEFGPPMVSVEIKDNNALVTMEGPMRYLPHNHTPAVPMTTLYPHMTYNLSVYNTYSGQTRHFPVSTNVYTYHMLDYGTEYCFSVNTKIEPMPTKHHASTWHCITIPQDPLIDQLKRIVVGIVVPAVLLCLLGSVGYVLYNYLSGKGQRSPYVLNPPSFHLSPVPFPRENSNIIVISLLNKDNTLFDMSNPPYRAPLSSPALTYATQRPEIPPPPEEPVDYGFVSANPGEEVSVGQSGMDSEQQGYKKKEWQIEAESSARSYACQNSFLQMPRSSTNPMLLSQTGTENQKFPGLSLHQNPDTGLLQLQLNTNKDMRADVDEQGHSVGESVVVASDYASQHIPPVPPSDLSDQLPDGYGVLGVVANQEVEDEGSLRINWDPSSRRIIFPELDLWTNGVEQSERENLLRQGNELQLENVLVRQTSEEEALIEEERSGRAEWEEEDIMTKWNLIVSDD